MEAQAILWSSYKKRVLFVRNGTWFIAKTGAVFRFHGNVHGRMIGCHAPSFGSYFNFLSAVTSEVTSPRLFHLYTVWLQFAWKQKSYL